MLGRRWLHTSISENHIFLKKYNKIPTFFKRRPKVSNIATLTLELNLSPRIRISGPVICTTEGLRASALVSLMISPNPFAALSLISCGPFKIPSRKIGRTGVIP